MKRIAILIALSALGCETTLKQVETPPQPRDYEKEIRLPNAIANYEVETGILRVNVNHCPALSVNEGIYLFKCSNE